jgi:hypothetical protein
VGYYSAGDGGSFGVLMSDQNQTALDSKTYVTPALARWRSQHPGEDLPPPAHRRMNIGNVRALRRSMRRVTGFAHLAKRVMSFTTHNKLRKRKARR